MLTQWKIGLWAVLASRLSGLKEPVFQFLNLKIQTRTWAQRCTPTVSALRQSRQEYQASPSNQTPTKQNVKPEQADTKESVKLMACWGFVG